MLGKALTLTARCRLLERAIIKQQTIYRARGRFGVQLYLVVEIADGSVHEVCAFLLVGIDIGLSRQGRSE